MQDAATVVDLVRWQARRQPHRIAYTTLRDGESEASSLTWAEVDRQARVVGSWLASRRAAGHRVVLLFPTGDAFVTTFFGCLYAGAAAVPAYPLDSARLERTVTRLRGMLADVSPRVVLSIREYREALRAMGADVETDEIPWTCVDEMDQSAAETWTPAAIGPSTLAVVQYTSGSIAEPKGVLVSHQNILANEGTIRAAHAYDDQTTFVSWVPLAHDWGLINSVIQPAYVGGHSVLITTDAFLEKPARWLQAIARYSNVASGGPNFAYDLCLRKVSEKEREALDLRSWRWAGVSAGPVLADTLERFAATFADCGFQSGAFYSGYGLAEATLLVADSERGRFPGVLRADRAALQSGRVVECRADQGAAAALVTCGPPGEGVAVRIVDPMTLAPLESDRVGEIWIGGASVTLGYWNNPDETAAVFNARTSEGDGPFLRSGDLGFVHEGELFVCGRLKDMVIVRGRNIYPHDIERTAEGALPALRPGGTVAFSAGQEGDEHLVVVQEVRAGAVNDAQSAAVAIARAIRRDHGVDAEIVLVPAGGVLKTSSGKLRRTACRDAWLAGSIEPLAHVPGEAAVDDRGGASQPLTMIERRLLALCIEVLDGRALGVSTPLLDVCDSVSAAQCLARVRRDFGVDVPLAFIFDDGADVRRLARRIEEILTTTGTAAGAGQP